MREQDNKSTIFKLTVLLVLIGAVIFTYYTYQTLAGTTLNKTLTTQTDLENGLVGHWTFDGPTLSYATISDVSGSGNNGNEFQGIGLSYTSGNLTFIANQFGGVSNVGEFDITCTGGDSNCQFKTTDGDVVTNIDISNGVACTEDATYTGYIMYSQENVHTRFSSAPYGTASDNFVCVRYSGGWQYDNNASMISFTPVSTDLLVAEIDTSADVITALNTAPEKGVAGKIGQALDFDGVDDYVDTNAQIQTLAPTDGSISWWQNSRSPFNDGQQNVVWYQSNGGTFPELSGFKYTDNKLYFGFNASGDDDRVVIVATASNWPQNTWSFYTLTWINGGFSRLYQNGSELGNNGGGTTISSPSANFLISKRDYSGPTYFNGSIDDVRVYSRALSADEITRLYNLGATTRINKTLTTNPDLESGLVGHWTFDGKETNWTSATAGTVTDRSGNANTGTLTNMNQSTSPIAGKIGQALDFDGSEVRTSANPLSGLGAFSVSGWVRPDTTTGKSFAITEYWKSGDLQILIRGTGGTVQFFTYTGAQVGGNISTYTANEWQHFVATYDGSTMRMYKNTVVSATTYSQTGNIRTTNVDQLRIGGGSGDANSEYYMNGVLDDVRVYNHALSADEVKRLYNLGATTVINKTLTTNPDLESGLVGHWTFDGPDLLQNATDRSGQGNNGFLTNFTSTTTVRGKIGQALDFDGVDDVVCVLDDSTLDFAANDSFTVSFWVKFNTAGQTSRAIVEKWSGSGGYPYAFRVSSGGSLHWVRYDGTNGPGGTFIASPAANTWYHVVGVKDKDSDNMYSYLDGVLKDTDQDTTTGTTANSSGLGFGARGCGYLSTYVDATIDDVRVYNHALSADEVKRLYLLGK